MSQDTESLLSAHLAKVQQRVHSTNAVSSPGNGLSAPQVSPQRYTDGIPDHKRGKLLTPLYGCGIAVADPLIGVSSQQFDAPPGVYEDTSGTSVFLVYDPLSKVNEWDLMTIADDEGNFYLPAGTCVDCHWADDAQRWEYENAGLCCEASQVSEESSEASEASEVSQSELSEGSQSEGSLGSQQSQLSQLSQASETSETSGGGGGNCCQCPTDGCTGASPLKATVTFPAPYGSYTFTANLTQTGCSWAANYSGGPGNVETINVQVYCVGACWVVLVDGTITTVGPINTNCKSDPQHCGAPYPPTGVYNLDNTSGGGDPGCTVTLIKQ